MHNFCMVFGGAMMIFFALIAAASIVMFIGTMISGVQFLLLIPCCAAGAGLSSELLDYGLNVREK